MFDLTNPQELQRIIDARDESQYVIPLYVVCAKQKYGLLEMDQIDQFDSNWFRVGFGASTSLFIRNSFNIGLMQYFNPSGISAFDVYDEEKGAAVRYTIFESTGVPENTNPILDQVNAYVDMLGEHISNIMTEKRAKRIEELRKSIDMEIEPKS